MTKRASLPSSKQKDGRAEESGPQGTTSYRFQTLAKSLLGVPMEKVKAEEAREKAAKKARKKRLKTD